MSKADILQTNAYMPRHQAQLDDAFNVLKLWQARDRDAFFKSSAHIRGAATGAGFKFNREVIDALPKLEVISSMSVGVDSIDVAYAKSRGIVVTNTPDVLTEEVADTALLLLLSLAKQGGYAERYLRAGRWPKEGAAPLAMGLRDKTLGVLGLGRIGEAVARRAVVLGMNVIYHNRRPKGSVPYTYYADLVEMAKACDVLMIVTPGGKETFHLVGEKVFRALGPDGYVVNIARGSVIDEAALVRALKEKWIAGAGLDVFENEPLVPAELIAMEQNVVLLPHIGSATVETRNAMGDLAVANLRSFMAGKGPLTPV
jgi:lactate dehydrogenase-like 2-hydroxyacid dehydrogenase